VQKRTPEEQEKFAKPYEKTLLTEIPLDQVFTPQTSRPMSPKLEPIMNNSSGGTVEVLRSRGRSITREDSSAIFFTASPGGSMDSGLGSRDGLNGPVRGKLFKACHLFAFNLVVLNANCFIPANTQA